MVAGAGWGLHRPKKVILSKVFYFSSIILLFLFQFPKGFLWEGHEDHQCGVLHHRERGAHYRQHPPHVPPFSFLLALTSQCHRETLTFLCFWCSSCSCTETPMSWLSDTSFLMLFNTKLLSGLASFPYYYYYCLLSISWNSLGFSSKLFRPYS